MLLRSAGPTVPSGLARRLLRLFSQRHRKHHFFGVSEGPPSSAPPLLPQQYPQNLTDQTPMVRRGRPLRLLSPRGEVPQEKLMSNDDVVVRQVYGDQWRSPTNAYRLNVGLVGPVNSGKSQLLSALSTKVSAVSPKRGTTEEVVVSFRTGEVEGEEGTRQVQLKYFDSPGLAPNKTGFLSRGWGVLGEVDFSLMVVDSSRQFDQTLFEAIRRLQKHRRYEQFMKALVLNKVDLVDNKRKFHTLIAEIQRHGKFDKIFFTSALTGYGIAPLHQYLLTMAKPGQWEVPPEAVTTNSEVELIEEMLRQALFLRTYNQVPYQTLIECQSLASRSDGLQVAEFRLIVEDQNVQRMVVGKKGRNVQWMRQHFRSNYARHFGRPVEVHIRVVARKKRLMQSLQQIEESYHLQSQQQQMEILKEDFDRSGRLIRR